MPFGNFNDGRYNQGFFCQIIYSLTMHTGVVDKRTSVPQIRPEILPLIGSAIILGRDIQLLDKIGQGTYKMIVLQSAIHIVQGNRRCRTHFVCVMPCIFGNMKLLGTFEHCCQFMFTHT